MANMDLETQKLEKRLCRQVGQAVIEYNMIEQGDKVMVCVSGGKDSYAMLDIRLKLRARAGALRRYKMSCLRIWWMERVTTSGV